MSRTQRILVNLIFDPEYGGYVAERASTPGLHVARQDGRSGLEKRAQGHRGLPELRNCLTLLGQVEVRV